MSGDYTTEDMIVASLRQIIRAIDLHSRHLSEAFGLTGPQLAVLREAERHGPMTAAALARAVHLSNPTMTGILRRIEGRGLIRRTPGERDRRTITVELTDAGRDLLTRSPSLLQDRFRQELEALAGWERNQILATLQRIAAMMEAEHLDAAPHLVTDEQSLRPEPERQIPPPTP